MTPSLPTPVLLSPPFCHHWGLAGRQEGRRIGSTSTVGRSPASATPRRTGEEEAFNGLFVRPFVGRTAAVLPSFPFFLPPSLRPALGPFTDSLLPPPPPAAQNEKAYYTSTQSPPPCRLFFFPLSLPSLGRRPPPNRGHGSRLPSSSPPLGRHHCCIGAPTQKEKKKTKTKRRPFPSIHYACWLPFGLPSLPWAFSSNVREREKKVLLINATGKREEEEGGRRTKQSNGDGGGTGWSFPPLAKLGR